MNEIVLQGRGICKSYGSKRNRRQVLFDVDIEVRSGECLAIIGASGSGKSTLTRVLFGLESADCGEIAYRGQAMGERNDAVREHYDWSDSTRRYSPHGTPWIYPAGRRNVSPLHVP